MTTASPETIARFPFSGLAPYLLTRTRLRLAKGNPSVETTALGKSVTLDCRDAEQRYFAADCTREPENFLLYSVIAHSGLATTFVDVGANCGLVAASVRDAFSKLVLVEPNPKLAAHLRHLFSDYTNIQVVEKAIVGEGSGKTATLRVPVGSSGLASIGSTHLSQEFDEFVNYDVAATSLREMCSDIDMSRAYIKIDVEGQEEAIISASAKFFDEQRPIVGFEALTREHARTCASYFRDCRFYHARFAFMDRGGSLQSSKLALLKAVVAGSHFVVLKEGDPSGFSVENYSQLVAVPNEKVEKFEAALRGSSFARSSTRLDQLNFLNGRKS